MGIDPGLANEFAFTQALIVPVVDVLILSVYEGSIGTWMGSGPPQQQTAVVDLVVDQPMGAPGVGVQPQSGAVARAQDALLTPSCVDFYTRVLNSPYVNTKRNPVLERGNLFKIFGHFLAQKERRLDSKTNTGRSWLW